MTRLRRLLARMSYWADLAISLLKWPVAIVALVALPKAALAFFRVVGDIAARPVALLPLLLGMGGYFAAWWLLLRRRAFGHYFSTLEHELTHALFALLTWHRVTGLRATWRRGGSVAFRGRGNWLITIAPYFFPTAAFAVLAVLCIVPEEWQAWVSALLGAATGWHVTSTIRETHAGQSDLKLVGPAFAVMFLPSANLIALGLVLSTAIGGGSRALEFLKELK